MIRIWQIVTFFFYILMPVPLAGCDRRKRQCVGSLLRWLGSYGSGLLSGCCPPGPLLQDDEGFDGTGSLVTNLVLGPAMFSV